MSARQVKRVLGEAQMGQTAQEQQLYSHHGLDYNVIELRPFFLLEGVMSTPIRLLTVADLAVLPSDLPSGPVYYELDNGRLVIMPPPGDFHGAVESNLTTELKLQGERRGHGKVRCGEVAVILWRDPDRVVAADAVFIANCSLPLRLSAEGYLETIPDLVSEVRIKNQSLPAMQRKVEDYLTAGVRVVWVLDTLQRTVTAYRRDRNAEVFAQDDILIVEDVIPGFRVVVRDLFQD
jgi:Uma2 family endonuclease